MRTLYPQELFQFGRALDHMTPAPLDLPDPYPQTQTNLDDLTRRIHGLAWGQALLLGAVAELLQASREAREGGAA